MSEPSGLSADEPKSASEIVKASTNRLGNHAPDRVDVITESLSAPPLIETGGGSESRTESTLRGEAKSQEWDGADDDSSSGNRGETGVHGGADTRTELRHGRAGEDSGELLGDAGAGPRDQDLAETGPEAGTDAGLVRDHAGSQRPAWSNLASAPFGSPGEVNELLEKNVPSDTESARAVIAFMDADRRESFNSWRGDAEFAEETDNGTNETLEIFAFSSSGPQTDTGQKKRPETLASHRWKKAYQFVKKENAMKKKALKSPIGTGATLDGYALGFLSIHSEMRTTLFAYLYNEKAEYLLFGIIVSHLFVLILKAEYKWVTNFHPADRALNIADIALTSVYTAECVCRIIILGFIRGPHAYLRNNYNIADFVIVIDSWVHIIRTLILEGDAFLRLAVLRVFRALLILRAFSFIGNVLAILDAIMRTLPPLKFMAGIMLMFLACYSSLGEAYFLFTLRFRCRRQTDGELSYPELFCAPGKINSCPDQQGLVCSFGDNPNYGITNFENVGAIYLILVQVVSFEGWSLLMLNTRKGSGTDGADAYFIIMVILGGYFLVNVLIAAVSGVFLRVRQEHQLLLRKYRREKEFSFANAIKMASLLKDVITSEENLTWRQRFKQRATRMSRQVTRTFSRENSRLRSGISRAIDWRDPNSYLRRMSSGGVTGLVNVGDISPSGSAYRLSFSRSLSGGARFGRSLSRSLSLTSAHWVQKLVYICWIIVHSKVFKYGVLFLITFITAFMCTLSTKSSRRRLVAVQTTEKVMVGIFWAELVVRFLAVGFYEFVDESINMLDLAVLIISSCSLGFVNHVPNVLPVRMLRWFYVKRSSRKKNQEESSPILVSILRSFPAVVSVFLFFFINIFIISIFSAELWGGNMTWPSNDVLPRGNYDTLPQAMLLWFTVSTGESWVNQMWNVLRPGAKNRWAAPIFFVSYYVSVGIFTINLIIAAILEETELTDYQKKLIQKRDHVKYLQVKHIRRLSSSRSADWLLSIVEYFKGVKRRLSSMRITSLSDFTSSTLQVPQAQRTGEAVPPTASSSQDADTFGGSTQITSDIAVPIPGSAAVDGVRSTNYRDLKPSGGVLPRIFSYRAVDKLGSAADGNSKARISRRRSASVLSSIALPALRAPSKRRFSLASDGIFLRSGFKGTNLAPTVDGGNRTALQAALLAVADDHALVASVVVATQAEDNLKSKVTPEDALYGRKRSGSRISFVLSDFEGIQPIREKATPWWMKDRSLFLFQPESKIRLFVVKVVEHIAYRWWEVMWCSWSVFVMVETDGHGDIRANLQFLNDMDKVVFAVFLLDLVLKSVAYGFLLTREAYLEDPYNWIDVLNLICHCVYLKDHTFQDKEYYGKAALLLMACRPFRFIPRFQNLRTLSNCILRTFAAVGQVFLFTVVVYIIFALIGMQLFANRFRSCTDSSVKGHVDCVGMFRNDVGLLAPRTWVNPPFHFDAFGEAMLALVVCSTFDNWLEYFLYRAMDITEYGLSPRKNATPAHAIYFICFVSIGGFFILRMFLGVLIDQFGVMSGTKLMTERQKLWRDTNRIIQSLIPIRRPAVPGMWIRRFFYKIVYNRVFEWLVILCLTVNFIVYAGVAIDARGQTNISIITIYRLEYFYNVAALLEITFKFLATELGDWWYDKWNLLELFLVIPNASTRFMSKRNKPTEQLSLFILGVKIFRIVRYLRGLRTALVTVAVSLPSMLDITTLLAICLFALAQVGTQVFFHTKEGMCIKNGRESSFETWLTSFHLLLQITTLDNWSCLMIDITRNKPFCVREGSTYASECGFPVWGIVYMIFCICTTTYIFGNLFVAKVLDSITFGLLSENALVTPTHLEEFRLIWAKDEFDSRCKGCIPHHKVKEFLIRLGYPLGGRRFGFIKWYSHIEYEIFHFRSAKGVPFRPLLETVVLYKIGARGLELPVRIEREKRIQGIYQNGAAMKIQGFVRGFLQRRRNKRVRLQEADKNDGGGVSGSRDDALNHDNQQYNASPDDALEDDTNQYIPSPNDPPDIKFPEDPAWKG